MATPREDGLAAYQARIGAPFSLEGHPEIGTGRRSDLHVTGINPAGNASLTDAAFVTGRFAWAMWRRPVAA